MLMKCYNRFGQFTLWFENDLEGKIYKVKP